tara:strand:+ start:638 stop:985 length:348 start_codon:yes stop_codon:yes gene_type:complete
MGFFSWYTNDTRKVIWNRFAKGRKVQTVYLIDNKGNKYKEDNYEGYGVFGGKDFFVVVAEMNGIESNENSARSLGIKLVHSNKPYLSPNLVTNPETPWKNKAPEDHEGQGFWNWK